MDPVGTRPGSRREGLGLLGRRASPFALGPRDDHERPIRLGELVGHPARRQDHHVFGKRRRHVALIAVQTQRVPAVRTVASTELSVRPRPQMYSAIAMTEGWTHASSNTGSSPSGVARLDRSWRWDRRVLDRRQHRGADPIRQVTIDGDDGVPVLPELVQVLFEADSAMVGASSLKGVHRQLFPRCQSVELLNFLFNVEIKVASRAPSRSPIRRKRRCRTLWLRGNSCRCTPRVRAGSPRPSPSRGLEQNLNELREDGYTIVSVDRDLTDRIRSRGADDGRGRARSQRQLRSSLRDPARRRPRVRGGVGRPLGHGDR